MTSSQPYRAACEEFEAATWELCEAAAAWDDPGPRQRDALTRIERAARRVRDALDGVLRVARADIAPALRLGPGGAYVRDMLP